MEGDREHHRARDRRTPEQGATQREQERSAGRETEREGVQLTEEKQREQG